MRGFFFYYIHIHNHIVTKIELLYIKIKIYTINKTNFNKLFVV